MCSWKSSHRSGLIFLFMLNVHSGHNSVLSSDMWKFHQTTGHGVADVPVSMNSVCTVCDISTRGKGGAADFIVLMWFLNYSECFETK